MKMNRFPRPRPAGFRSRKQTRLPLVSPTLQGGDLTDDCYAERQFEYCKLQIANCKFEIFILQFAICNDSDRHYGLAANGHRETMTASEFLKEKFGELVRFEQFRDNLRAVAPASRIYEVLQHLKDSAGFNMLVDLTCVDYLYYPDAKDRFAVVYCLLNVDSGERIVVKTYLNEPALSLRSAYSLWKSADWLEREVFDMFGIVFEGHPDLRRILMPEEFTAFPLRKDYPLRGRGERHNFPVITRAES